MQKEKLTDIIFKMAEPIAKNNGCDIADIEYKKEGSDYFLRIFIEKSDGTNIGIDDCEKVSRALSDELDKADPIKEAYILEVSSPGIDRPLKKEADFKRFAGKTIDIGLYKPIDGLKTVSGTLLGFDGGVITIETDGKEMNINQKDTTFVKLAVIFKNFKKIIKGGRLEK